MADKRLTKEEKELVNALGGEEISSLMKALTSKEEFFRTAWLFARDKVAKKAGEMAAPAVEKTIKAFAPGHASQAEAIGRIAGKATHVGIVVGDNAKQYVDVGRDTVRNLRQLRKVVDPYLESGRFGIGALQRSDNEMIRNARSEVLDRGKYDFYTATVGLSALVPNILDMAGKQGKLQGGKGEVELAPEGSEGVIEAKPDASKSWPERAEDRWNKAEEAARRPLGKLANSPLYTPENLSKFKLGIRLGAPRLQQMVKNEKEERFGHPSAFELTIDLSRQVNKTNGPIRKVMHKGQKKQLPLAEYVMEVFKQHQLDGGDIELNGRRSEPDMEEVCALIAEAIDNRQIDPKALIALVGERQVVDTDLNVASPEEVRDLIRDVQRREERAEKVDIKAYMADSAYTEEELREIFDDLSDEEKPFFACLLPDEVLRKVLRMDQEEIDGLKDAGFEEFYETMGRHVNALAEMDEKDLQRTGLTKKQSSMIHKWAKSLDLDNPEAFAAMDGDELKSMGEAVGSARGYWQDRIRGEANSAVKAEPEQETQEAAQTTPDADVPEKPKSFASKIRSEGDRLDKAQYSKPPYQGHRDKVQRGGQSREEAHVR